MEATTGTSELAATADVPLLRLSRNVHGFWDRVHSCAYTHIYPLDLLVLSLEHATPHPKPGVIRSVRDGVKC